MAVGRARPGAPLDADAGDAHSAADRHQGGARWQSRPRPCPRARPSAPPRGTQPQAPRALRIRTNGRGERSDDANKDANNVTVYGENRAARRGPEKSRRASE